MAVRADRVRPLGKSGTTVEQRSKMARCALAGEA